MSIRQAQIKTPIPSDSYLELSGPQMNTIPPGMLAHNFLLAQPQRKVETGDWLRVGVPNQP
jgi:hypothetical protein